MRLGEVGLAGVVMVLPLVCRVVRGLSGHGHVHLGREIRRKRVLMVKAVRGNNLWLGMLHGTCKPIFQIRYCLIRKDAESLRLFMLRKNARKVTEPGTADFDCSRFERFYKAWSMREDSLKGELRLLRCWDGE